MIAVLFEAAVRSLTLGVLVWLAMLALRPRNPHLQKTVWITVLLASLIMPFAVKTHLAPSFDVPTSLIVLTQSVTGATDTVGATAQHWPVQAITATYALIAATLLGRFVIGLFAMSRIWRKASPLPNADGLDIRVSAKIASPATFGSTILLPASSVEWNDETLAAILSHERSHVRYWDCYVQWLARVHACVFWFNPLAWWLSRRLADLAETTSDDAVIQAMSDRTAYADMLLEIARHPAPTMVTSAARSNISARIERIISDIPPALPPRRWVRGAAVVALMPLFVLAAATAQPPSGLTQTPPPGAGGSSGVDPMTPKMIYHGDLSEDDYPRKAKRQGIEGLAIVNATIDADGNITATQVTVTEPATGDSYGFAEASARLAKTVRFSNPRHQPTQVKYKVKFELPEKHRGDQPLPRAPIQNPTAASSPP